MPKGEKIQSIIQKYGLSKLGDELVEQWTDPENAKSLHELEAYVNQRIVQQALAERTQEKLSWTQSYGEIAKILQADGSSANRFDDISQVEIVDVKNRLSEQNIDVDELSNDFVSYNTIYHYLTDIRGVTASDDRRKATTPEERQNKVVDRLSNLTQRVDAVTEQGLESLVSVDIIPESYDVRIKLRVECTKCDRRQNLLEYIRNHGCTACSAHRRTQE